MELQAKLDKINESLVAQRDQLLKLLDNKSDLETNLSTLTNAIAQLRGSIAALEYVKTLDSQV